MRNRPVKDEPARPRATGGRKRRAKSAADSVPANDLVKPPDGKKGEGIPLNDRLQPWRSGKQVGHKI